MQVEREQENNAKKALQSANMLFPHEKWEIVEEGIFISKNRMPRSAEQVNILEKELQQARILAARGSTIYLLPENLNPKEKNKKYPDAVVNGYVMEFKTISGSLRQVEVRYREARKKAAYIFMKINSHLSRHDFTRKLSGYIKRKGFSGGVILAHFSCNNEFYQWTEEELTVQESLLTKSTQEKAKNHVF